MLLEGANTSFDMIGLNLSYIIMYYFVDYPVLIWFICIKVDMKKNILNWVYLEV